MRSRYLRVSSLVPVHLCVPCRSTSYVSVFSESVNDRERFWSRAADGVSWFKPFNKVYDGSKSPFERWFVGGELNTCYNAIDRHVDGGLGDRVAVIHDSPVTDTVTHLTYSQLLLKVQKMSGVLESMGVSKGDMVIIYLPMIPEALIAMLACARIGATHSVVFGGFAAPELAVRIRDCKPKVLLTASCGIDGSKVIRYKPLVDEAIELAADEHRVHRCVVLQRQQHPCDLIPGRDHDWEEEFRKASAFQECVPMKSEDPLYVLYTSGTTGRPKGVVRDTGGHAVALHWSMKHAFGMDSGDVWWAASDVGWVVGHSFSVYAPLLRACTTIFYEGKPVGTPDASAFWRVIEQHKVCGMFTAPTAIRAIRQQDTEGVLPKSFNIQSLRTLFLAGERADSATIKWAENHLNVPVRDNWWQTETGWPICANLVGLEGYLPVKYGSVYRPCPGYDLRALDSNNNQLPPGKLGQLAVKLPLPPGTLQTLYNNDTGFLKSYMSDIPGYYNTGDAGIIDEEGHVYVMTRTDDVINVAGHRLSSGAMEEILSDHPDIAEAVVIGVKDPLKGQVPLGLAVMNENATGTPDSIESAVVQMVRDRIGAVACFKRLIIVNRFPKTRSGKITRNVLRLIADGMEYSIPATVDDPSVYDDIKRILAVEKEKYVDIQ